MKTQSGMRVALGGLFAVTALVSCTAQAQSSAQMPIQAPAPHGELLPGASLETLLAYAREHNPELAAMRAEQDAAEARVEPAGALPDPMLRIELQDATNEMAGGGFNVLPARVGSTKYTVSQALPFWGKRDLKREAAAADAEQARGRLDVAWLDLATRLKVAYAQYYLAAHSERLTREVLGLLWQLEKITQNRYAGGLIPQQDVIRAQFELSATKSEVIMLETERHHLRSRLNALLKRPAHAQLAEPKALRALPPAARLQPAVLEEKLQAASPLLRVNDAQASAAEKTRDLVYRNRYPDFTLGIVPIQTRNRVSEWELMFEMNLPLQQGARRAQEREAEAMLAAAKARREASGVALKGELAETLISLESARRIEQINTSSLLPQAELTYQAALAGYENGKVDFATLLDAQRQIRKARLDILKAQVDQQLALAQIEKLVGEEL